ncbi:MAG: DUF3048 domain-containing protein [Lachnospiraceae bacterium]|nr:DUF3048 domain-containing protein [Lachnospiraceae bacterium]
MRIWQRKIRFAACILPLLAACLLGGLSGCGKKPEGGMGSAWERIPDFAVKAPSTTTTPTPLPSPTPTPDPYMGKKQSMLTGEWIDKEQVEQRPYAVMLNNIKVASPQSGIGQADIVYEALTEAGITRFLALFSSIGKDTPAADRLGSVRSARHYFVSFADEYDAIFVHFGETTYATKKMKKLGIDHITGMYGAGVASFYRDKSIKAPHNAFASLEGILTALERAGIRTEYEEGYEAHFRFYAEDTDLMAGEESLAADGITLGFSAYTSPYFTYDKETKLYTRYQFGGVHTDYNTGGELKFKNLIIQFVDEWNIDKNGYQTMDIEDAKGTGYYLTNGICVSVTWVKKESTRFMRYYGTDGEELTINPGKTYIAVFPQNREKYITIGQEGQ